MKTEHAVATTHGRTLALVLHLPPEDTTTLKCHDTPSTRLAFKKSKLTPCGRTFVTREPMRGQVPCLQVTVMRPKV